MNREAYIQYWSNNGEKLYVYAPSQVDTSKVGDDSFTFLTSWGFPSDAAPFLSFRMIRDGKLLTPNEAFHINVPGLNKYLMFGSNGDGDPVCIDTQKDGQIVYLNHDDYFAPAFVNGTLMKFGLCLIQYRDFIMSIINDEVEELSARKFTDQEFQNLQTAFIEIDGASLAHNSFWEMELQGLLWERDNE